MDDIENTTIAITRDIIEKAKANTLDVANNEESYQKYFRMGGTVGKMSINTTKNYHYYLKKRVENRGKETVEETVEKVVEE